uniref:Uncharacterized protein n=1 Tax=Trichobilharzia regenti TaxID=157069 RepID=A0AA85JUY6_TRIRE|nr:unnamed protein product [Trichobilharzia regenti]
MMTIGKYWSDHIEPTLTLFFPLLHGSPTVTKDKKSEIVKKEAKMVIDGLWFCDSARTVQAFLDFSGDGLKSELDEKAKKGFYASVDSLGGYQAGKMSMICGEEFIKTLGTMQPIRCIKNAIVTRRQMLAY